MRHPQSWLLFHVVYGTGTLSPDKRLAHCTVVAFEMLAPPVIIDFESQNRSTTFPRTWVGGFVEILDKFTVTKPPCWLPVTCEPSRLA